MIQKRPIRPERLRQVPPSFNWVDHRLVRERYLDRCDCTSLALYLFLVTVSEAQGLSYYSDASLCRRLKIDPLQLAAARGQLEKADLIAYRKPLYQVLSLDQPLTSARSQIKALPKIKKSERKFALFIAACPRPVEGTC